MSTHPTRRAAHQPTWCAATLLALTSTASQAQGIDQAIDSFFSSTFGWFVALIFYSVPVGEAQFPLIVGWLLLAAIIFNVYFGVPQFSRFKLAIDLVRGRYTDPNDRHPGEVSHFQALTTALSGTVGLGNIAGSAWRWPSAGLAPPSG